MPSQNPSYDPQEDSFLLEKWVKTLARGKLLDIGTGSGILAVAAANRENVHSVIAVDVQKETIANCKKNIVNKKIKFIFSDLFSAFKKKGGKKQEKTFDTIIFNPPYLPNDTNNADAALDGGKHGYEIIERFLKEANDYLENEGIILLLFSSLTKKEKVDGLILENLFSAELLEKQHVFFEDLYVYKIAKTPLLKELTCAGVSQIRYHAKGKRGIVYMGKWKAKKVAIKITNPKSLAIGKIAYEMAMLKKLNAHGIGPKLLHHSPNFLIQEFIEGEFIGEFIGHSSSSAAKKALKSVMAQMKALDDWGITKEEMQRPHRHIIIRQGMPILIDFERAHYSPRPANVTQFCQYLLSTNMSPILREKNINIDKAKLIGLAREYKNAASKKEKRQAFLKITREIVSS